MLVRLAWFGGQRNLCVAGSGSALIGHGLHIAAGEPCTVARASGAVMYVALERFDLVSTFGRFRINMPDNLPLRCSRRL